MCLSCFALCQFQLEEEERRAIAHPSADDRIADKADELRLIVAG